MVFKSAFRRMVFLLAVSNVLFASVALAADKPDLSVPSGIPKLEIAFADPQTWNGKRIPVALQCVKRGGVKPVLSPELKISGSPAATKDLVVFFNDPRAFNNHGLFAYTGEPEGGVFAVPGVTSSSAKLGKDVALFQGGSRWGFAYSAPCPLNSMQHHFTVMVYARDAAGIVIAVGETSVGYAE